MAELQASREIRLKSPLGKDKLLFLSMTGTESLGRLFEYYLDVLSEDAEIEIPKILGQGITVELDLDADGDKTRYFHGVVTSFRQVGSFERFTQYQAILRPHLWMLTRTSDCRIFQEMTVPDILREMFDKHGLTDFEDSTRRSFRSWNYCVQYRETDFNFVQRLMEQEGIYYYFKYEDGKHVMVMADDSAAHESVSDYDSIPYREPGADDPGVESCISEWNYRQEIQSGTCALDEYDFQNPKANLEVKSQIKRDYTGADTEIYDYPGAYGTVDEGDAYALLRIQELQTEYEIFEGTSNARGISCGSVFELIDHTRADQNAKYLLNSVSYFLQRDASQYSGGDAEPDTFQCDFQAIPSKTIFRPARNTPKPLVKGPQTAVVVGKSGEEIWTDEFGRVKVQFHWDRHGNSDENSSTWVRVSQIHAGKGFGGIDLPRMGDEVIVEFLEGDPDRPIITGRVYNADNKLPYALPANQTQSGMKSRSSKTGTADNFNEIRFEDKKDSEEIYIHAEKDQSNVVENDDSQSVGNDQTRSIGNNRTDTVGKDESRSVGANRTVSIADNDDVSVGKNRSVSIGDAYDLTVGADRSMSVGANQTVSISSDFEETVGGSQQGSVGKDRETSIGKDDSVTVGKKHSMEAGDAIMLKSGKASISMKKDGTIVIKGKNITIEGSGKIDIKASKAITLKGSKVNQN